MPYSTWTGPWPIRVIRGNPGFWLNLPVLAAGFEILEEAHRLGFQIEGPRHSPMDKGLVYGELLVDDYPEYILRWVRWRKRGTVIMPDQPWNQGFEHPQVYRYAGDRQEMVRVLERVVTTARSGFQR